MLTTIRPQFPFFSEMAMVAAFAKIHTPLLLLLLLVLLPKKHAASWRERSIQKVLRYTALTAIDERTDDFVSPGSDEPGRPVPLDNEGRGSASANPNHIQRREGLSNIYGLVSLTADSSHRWSAN
jgi:hypothetical protein